MTNPMKLEKRIVHVPMNRRTDIMHAIQMVQHRTQATLICSVLAVFVKQNAIDRIQFHCISIKCQRSNAKMATGTLPALKFVTKNSQYVVVHHEDIINGVQGDDETTHQTEINVQNL